MPLGRKPRARPGGTFGHGVGIRGPALAARFVACRRYERVDRAGELACAPLDQLERMPVFQRRSLPAQRELRLRQDARERSAKLV